MIIQLASEIDSLIADKEKLIELLEEKRQAIITEAVTKGLNPNVKMKDSGVEWIGEIPEHWEITRLKYIAKVVMGQSPSSDDVNNIGIGSPFLQGNAEFSEMYPEAKLYCERPNKLSSEGDILFSVRAPVGAMNISDKTYGIGRGLCAIQTKIMNKFTWYLLKHIKIELNSKVKGSTFEAVTIEDIKNLICIVPPLVEQREIEKHLDSITLEINSLIINLKSQILKLKEYRQSLIYEAVTGKIDVRNYKKVLS
ncbi:restriction endonuclease S subunit [Robertmurraya andreesenii]|uniref:Restriction endonuclease S subunit n=1 Tax=Anoxybacillus andreesenii TaxID=1325932 RepID=A0ABT9VAC3_9BACL|nr:restriction endonuclease S subunit [Robertmurraya andreesenii]